MSGRVYTLADAQVSPCGLFRYSLRRAWVVNPERWLMWVMLNPSTADGTKDDPTIRRCVGFAERWGYHGIIVENLYAFRATEPRDLKRAEEPVGSENDAAIFRSAAKARRVVCAWGQRGPKQVRTQEVARLLDGYSTYAMGFTKHNYPRHPLMLPNNTRPEFWWFLK